MTTIVLQIDKETEKYAREMATILGMPFLESYLQMLIRIEVNKRVDDLPSHLLEDSAESEFEKQEHEINILRKKLIDAITEINLLKEHIEYLKGDEDDGIPF